MVFLHSLAMKCSKFACNNLEKNFKQNDRLAILGRTQSAVTNYGGRVCLRKSEGRSGRSRSETNSALLKVNDICLSNEIFFSFSEIYKLHLNQAIAHLAEDEVQKGAPISTLHRYINMITLDASRTFPKMGIFQKGGPYYEHLLRLLGTDFSPSSNICITIEEKAHF